VEVGIRFGVGRIRTAFPDWYEQVVDVFGSGDTVASRYVSTGTHTGTFWGIEPTGRRIEIQEISIVRIANDRIVEQWCMFDDLARLQLLPGKATATGCQRRTFAQGTEDSKSLPLESRAAAMPESGTNAKSGEVRCTRRYRRKSGRDSDIVKRTRLTQAV
jgi:hypothetical protein